LKILIADTSPLISLLVTNNLHILFKLYNQIYLPRAVWNELNSHIEIAVFKNEMSILSTLVKDVKLNLVYPGIDKGEIEAIVLYQKMNAHFLLIDDKKAREIAESIHINCIGILAILIKVKRSNLIISLREIFKELLNKKRYYKIEVLNQILLIEKEELI
jgi:predicted nucleic acid-binding protein